MKVTCVWRSVKPELVPLCIGLVWDTTSKKPYQDVPHVPNTSLTTPGSHASHDIPQRPWSKLGMDISTFSGKDYLLIVDHYSKYPEVSHLATKTTVCVISHLKTCFARHGITDTVIADKMPFGSKQFTQFAGSWGFKVKTSSPRHASSNGQSERSVGRVKQHMRKAAEKGRDVHLALLEYHNTPTLGLEYSPAQLLMSRMLKDKLPTPTSLLLPKLVQGAHKSLSARQQKKYHDRVIKVLPPLQVYRARQDSTRANMDTCYCSGKTQDTRIIQSQNRRRSGLPSKSQILASII